MNTTMRRIRDAVLLGIAWAAAWAPIALLIGVLIIDPDNSMDEMWPLAGIYPGFLCALVFSGLVALGRRKIEELSIARVGALGAVSGVLIGVLPFVIGDSSGDLPVWLLPVIAISAFTTMSTISAIATKLLSARIPRGQQYQRAGS